MDQAKVEKEKKGWGKIQAAIVVCAVIFFASCVLPSELKITINHKHHFEYSSSSIKLEHEHKFRSFDRISLDHNHKGTMWIHP